MIDKRMIPKEAENRKGEECDICLRSKPNRRPVPKSRADRPRKPIHLTRMVREMHEARCQEQILSCRPSSHEWASGESSRATRSKGQDTPCLGKPTCQILALGNANRDNGGIADLQGMGNAVEAGANSSSKFRLQGIGQGLGAVQKTVEHTTLGPRSQRRSSPCLDSEGGIL
eukprot:44800_1